MPLCTTESMLRVWRDFVKANPAAKRLPVVVSIVVHHGTKRWLGPRTLDGLVDPLVRKVPELRELVPNARILVDDVRALDDDAIRARTSLLPLQLALDRSFNDGHG